MLSLLAQLKKTLLFGHSVAILIFFPTAKFVLQGKEIDVNEGRRTRSQSRPATATPVKTPVKRAGTMQKTAKEGKEYVNRSKGKAAKGKGKAVLDDAGDDNVPEEKDGEEEAEDSKEEETAVE